MKPPSTRTSGLVRVTPTVLPELLATMVTELDGFHDSGAPARSWHPVVAGLAVSDSEQVVPMGRLPTPLV